MFSTQTDSVKLARDYNDTPVQAFVPDPAKSQVTSAMTGTLVFRKGPGGSVNISDWGAICVVPSADAFYYYNADTTRTFPLFSGSANIVWVSQLSNGESVTLVLGGGTASVQGN